MKKIGLLLVGLVATVAVMAQGIVFETGTWSEVLAKAKETGKPVFVDVFTTWCGPCKVMSRDIFPLESVGKVYNESFVSYKLDAEKGEGVDLAKKYAVQGYPTYLYLKPDGSVFYRFMGSMPEDAFLKRSQTALSESQDPKPISVWESEYPAHQSDTAFLRVYLKKRSKLSMSNVDLLDNYLKLIPESKRTPAFLAECLYSEFDNIRVGSLAFECLLKNHVAMDRLSSNVVYDLLEYALSNSVRDAARKKDESLMKGFIDVLSQLPPSKITMTSDKLYLDFYRYSGNRIKYYQTVVSFCNNSLMKTSFEPLDNQRKQSVITDLNEYAWQVFLDIDSKETLTDALKWSIRSNEMAPNHYGYLDTQACLLYKLGEKKAGIELEERAVALIDKTKSDYEKHLKVLNRMKAGEKIW